MQAKKILKNFILWPVVVLVILIIILRLSLMPLIESGASYWFKQQGVESEIDDLTFYDSDAKFTLSGLKAGLSGSPVLSVDQVSIEWSWSALWDQEVDLLTFNIDGLYLDIERGADNRLLIAGVDVEQLAGSEPTQASLQETAAVQPLEWILRLQNFTLSNFRVCYRDAAPQDICGRFDKLEWKGSINLDQAAMPESKVPLEVKGDLDLSGIRVDDNRLSSVLLSADNFSIQGIRVETLDQVFVEAISVAQLAFLERTGGDAKSQQTKFEKLQLNQLSLDSSKSLPNTAASSQARDDAKFSLAGLSASANGLPVFSVNRIALEWSWKALREQRIALAAFEIDGLNFGIERGSDERIVIAGVDIALLAGDESVQTSQSESPPWNFLMQDFNLSNFKVCYRDAAPQDICGRFDKFEWKGSIGLDQAAMTESEVPLQVSGDFGLSGFRVDDNRLSSVLLSVDKFSLEQVRVDTLDRISLASIGIEQLTLLESKVGDAGSQKIRFDRLQLSQLSLDSSKSQENNAGSSQARDDAKFSLSGLSASTNGSPVFSVNRIALEWSWTALREQQVALAAFEIDGVNFDIERGSDERLVIAGVDIALLAGDESVQTSQPESLPWMFNLQDFSLSNFKVCYRDAAPQDICGRLDKLEWKGSIKLDQAAMSESEVPLQVEGDFGLSGVRVDDNRLSSVLLSVDNFSLEQIRVDTLDRISLASIGIDQLALLESKVGDAGSQKIRFDRLQLNQLELFSTRNPADTASGLQSQHDAKFSLAGVRANVDGAQVFALKRVGLEWSWASLRDQLIDLAAVEVDGLSFDIEQGPGDELVIAGIDIGLLSATEQAQPTQAEASQWKLRLQRLDLTDPSICYREGATMEYCGQFVKLGWQGLVGLDFADVQAVNRPLQLRGDFNLSGVSLVNRKFERQLLGFEDFSVKNLQADTLESISSESVVLDKLVLLERRKTESIPQITRLENLQLNRLKLENLNHLEIDEITLLDHQVELLNREDNTLELNEWLEQKPLNRLTGSTDTTDLTDTTDTKSDSSNTALTYAIGTLTYKTDKSIEYRDNSFKPPFVFDMNSIRLSLKNLDSNKPDQDSDISYSAKIGKNALISASGTLKPLQPKPSFDLLGKISGLDLREFSAFSARAIGHRINSGQLDAKLKLMATDGVLKSEIDLTLNQFKLAALSPEDKQKLDAKLGLPLNSSLSLLKDRDNRIKLKIPVTGDLQNPDFDPTDAITQAVSKAITTTALLFYSPYGLVVLADGLFSLATALKFEPLRFTPGEAGIAATDATALEKIAVLMRDRPGVDVTLCPFTNTADRLLLLPETKDIPVADLKLDSDQQAALTALGELRSNQVKDYLVAQKIDPERLVLCQPVNKEGEGLGGVQISI